jgi:hypothetical protein
MPGAFRHCNSSTLRARAGVSPFFRFRPIRWLSGGWRQQRLRCNGVDDRNVPETPEIGQILVTRNDKIRPARKRGCEYDIVVRVAQLIKPIRPTRAASIRAPGGPPQTRPDKAVFVSSTSRTSLLGAIGVDLRLNLLGRHRRRRRLGESLARRVQTRKAELPYYEIRAAR